LGLYYLTRQKINALGEGSIFADTAEVHRAYESGAVALHAKVKLRLVEDGHVQGTRATLVDTTVGRALLSEILPKGMLFDAVNRTLSKKQISQLINTCYRYVGLKETVVFADQLMYLGFYYAMRSGASIGVDDLVIPDEKADIIAGAEREVKEIEVQYASGLVTYGERYNKIVDIWSVTSEQVAKAMMEKLATEEVEDAQGHWVKQESFNSVYMMADSGARGSAAQIRQLAGMRGLMSKPDGSIIETAITVNFREGLNVSQYFISTHGARKGLSDTALKTANSGYLTRRLVDVAQDLVINQEDCGTTQGIWVSPFIQGGDVIEPLRDRVLGRTILEDLKDLGTQDIILPAGTLLDERNMEMLERAGIYSLKVRSPITCELRFGMCAKCYGRDLARGHAVNMGEAIGVIAAQSIGEPGTQLTMRTFHIGGAASRATAINSVQVRAGGKIKLHNMKTVRSKDNKYVVVSRSGELAVLDPYGSERERYKLPYGSVLEYGDGESVKASQVVANWDPHTHPIITEVAGKIMFVDMVEGVNMTRQIDELTGLSTIMITETKQRGASSRDLKPMIKLVNEAQEDVLIPGLALPAQYFLPVDAMVLLSDGAWVESGDVVARIPQESSKTGDIIGGLPRVADLFEARRPKEPAILAEVSGIISFGKETKGKRRLLITPLEGQGDSFEILIPKWRHVTVFEGEHVERGEIIVDGAPNPHDILRLLGVNAFAAYIINEVQDVYRLQGVKINDKHIEVIIRQMIRKVLIMYPGDSGFLIGDQVEAVHLQEVNKALEAEGKLLAQYEPVLMGITKASLNTDSFISAASFQETTRVLTEAAVFGKVDELRGLKENFMVGRLIPGGTGARYHESRKLKTQEHRAQEMALQRDALARKTSVPLLPSEIEFALGEALNSATGLGGTG
jgi:DNA-directed RNA polymerase subunit beta'